MSLEGRLEDLGLGDILQIVSLSRKSGILTLETRETTGRIVFRGGEVICVSSSVYDENLGTLLVNRGVVEGEVLAEALALQQQGLSRQRLGAILAGRFNVPVAEVESAVRFIVEKIICSFFLLRSGTFSFKLCEPSELEVVRLEPLAFILEKGLSPQWLALEGCRILDELTRIGDVSSLHREISALLTPTSELAAARPPLREQPEGIAAQGATFNLGAELLQEIGGTVSSSPPGDRDSGAALNFLKGMLQELNNPVSSGGIILLVLRFAAEIMNRAVVFVIREDQIVGLGQFGIEIAAESPDARIRRMHVPVDADSLFRQALDGRAPIRVEPAEGEWDRYIVEQLGGDEPREVFLAPLLNEGRVVALIYGDNLPEDKPIGETEAFEIFISQAGLAMDKALLERRFKGSDI